MSAIQNANADVGAMVMELSEREYMVRGLGYLKSIGDIENVVVGATASATPIRVAELGRVPSARRAARHRGAGRAGDAVGGIVDHAFRRKRARTITKVEAKLVRDPEHAARRCRHHAGV
jgi:Cu(I)/Ag(I) efflux system membrane protein CusA/SilA